MSSIAVEAITGLAEKQAWWERQDLGYQDGELFFAGRHVAEMARQFGTPSFVYSLPRAKANLTRLHDALQATSLAKRYRLLYAMKANRFQPLLAGLKQSGLCGIDACSPAEVNLAISCGFSAREISFTAGSLSTADLAFLARQPELVVNCDSISAIRSWGQLRPGSSIGIRINPAMGVSRADNERLQYSGPALTKFGVYREQFDEALAVAREAKLTVNRIHFHTGCGYLNEQLPQWERVIQECLWFVDRCDTVTTVNVGGGLGVPHHHSDRPLDLKAWAAVLERQFGKRKLNIEIEPGEYVMKDAGLLLLGKTYCETKRDTVFLGVDAGFNIAPEPAWYDLSFEVLPLRDNGEPRKPVTVVGNINEALDVFYREAQLPDMSEQPYLALLNGGAYSSSMASNHCMRGEFREYLLA